MRVILLSDLHIKPNSKAENLPWVNHFCDFMKSEYHPKTLVFVLGDVIDKGSLNKDEAFDAADQIFAFIASELSSVYYKIAFIPGNHDYCNNDIAGFMKFCREHQTCGTIFDFSQNEAWAFSFDNINFIFVDSIQNGDYSIPGSLNISSIRDCIKNEKINIIFTHHSLIFEDSESHTGIVNQSEVFDFLERYKINFVFHGHAHATRCTPIRKDIMLYGIGSIGLDGNDLTDLQNEQEQFFEVQINRCGVESIVNWLWRSGTKKYEKISHYPRTDSQYEIGKHIPIKVYPKPENYILRHIMPRDLASADSLTRYLKSDEMTTLFEVCQKNKHILFIADAGLGKTFEMEYLAYEISVKNPYKRAILLQLKSYNGGHFEDYIYISAQEYKTLDPEQLLLIMDGYDELADPGKFERALSQYMVKNPNTHICISMRSNFLSANKSAFQNFFVYQLLELESTDIQSELQKNGLDEAVFIDECEGKNIRSLLQNPFYLGKLINIFISDRSLPNQTELMDRIIEEQFTKDTTKFEYTLEISFEDCRYEVERALNRFAYGLQLLNSSTWDEKTYQTILCTHDRTLIRCSSLTINTQSGHGFSHNIFREYLIAKYLSLTSYENIRGNISIPGTMYLNPYWFNILGFLMQKNKYTELKEWLIAAEPLALTKIEFASFTDEFRCSILESTLLSIVNKNIWFRNEVCSETDLATFSQSIRAIDLLLKHIEAPAHFRSLYFCLSILTNFTELYGKDNRVRLVLMDCYQNDRVRAHEKRVAISAIAALDLGTQEITEDLVTRFAINESSDERLGVYGYLLHVKKINESVNFLLSGIKKISYSYKSNELSNAAEHYKLMDCLRNISEPDAIDRVIAWYSCKENMELDFYGNKKLFSVFFDKAVECYNSGYLSLFETVYTFYINTNLNHYRYNISDTMSFFTHTGTMEVAFERLVREDSEVGIVMIEDAINAQPNLIDLLCHLYSENRIKDPNLLKQIALRYHRTKDLFQKCSAVIKQKTGEVLEMPLPPVDYEQQRKDDTQFFFNSLFDQSSIHNLLIAIVDLYDNTDMTYTQLRETRFLHKNYPIGTKMLMNTLIQCEFKEERILDFIDLVDWETFFINRICYLFSNEKAMTFLVVSDKQKKVLYETYLQLEKNLDLHMAINEPDVNHYFFSPVVKRYMILKDTMGFKSPTHYYLGLLEIPYHFINGISKVEEKYILIEQHIPSVDIAKQIAMLVPQETRISVLEDLMFGCKRYCIKSCKDAALRLCQINTYEAYTRRNALEYLLDIFDPHQVLNELMPLVDDSLFELIVDRLRPDGDELLKGEILKRYKKNPSDFFIKELIALNVSEGLRAYIDACKKARHSMYGADRIGKITEAISLVHDVALLPLLLDAVRLRFSDAFTDNSFYSLYGSLLNALTACAKNDFELVWTAIEDLKKELPNNSEAISFCNVLQDDILKDNKMNLIKKPTVTEVKEILYAIK